MRCRAFKFPLRTSRRAQNHLVITARVPSLRGHYNQCLFIRSIKEGVYNDCCENFVIALLDLVKKWCRARRRALRREVTPMLHGRCTQGGIPCPRLHSPQQNASEWRHLEGFSAMLPICDRDRAAFIGRRPWLHGKDNPISLRRIRGAIRPPA